MQRILEKLQSGDRLLTPRLYTGRFLLQVHSLLLTTTAPCTAEDKYCASLSVDYFPQLPVYHCRSLMFSAQEDTAAYSGDTANDWMVDLYPKGVWFQKCFKIFHAGAMQEVRDLGLRDLTVSTLQPVFGFVLISEKWDVDMRIRVYGGSNLVINVPSVLSYKYPSFRCPNVSFGQSE